MTACVRLIMHVPAIFFNVALMALPWLRLPPPVAAALSVMVMVVVMVPLVLVAVGMMPMTAQVRSVHIRALMTLQLLRLALPLRVCILQPPLIAAWPLRSTTVRSAQLMGMLLTCA